MNRSLIFVLLGIALLVGALIAFDVIPLGPSGGREAGVTAPEADLLEGGVESDGTGTLKGRGAKPGEAPEPAAAPMQVDVAAEVRGGTKGGGAVRGRVVRGAGAVPLRGVEVSLARPDSIFTYLKAKANGRFDQLVAKTGADGRFAFLDVTPSREYVVRTSHAEFAAASSKKLDLRGRETIDLGDLALGPGGALRGRVIDAAEKPVAGVRVVVTWRISNPLAVILSDPEAAPELERETTTDDEGRYRLEMLDPSPKTLFAVAPSGAAEIVHSVTVEAGTTKDVDDIRLPGEGFVAGTVKWKDGTPISGVRVFAGPMVRSGATRPTETDAAGRFRIGWLPDQRALGVGAYIPGLPVWLEQGIDVGTDDLAIVFDMPGSLAGTVRAADGGKPVSRFFVQLDNEVQEEDWMRRIMATQVKRGLGPAPFEDESGAFSLPHVAAGTYTLVVTAPGFPEIRKAGVSISAGQKTDVVIEIPKGNVARGRVRRSNGAPAGGARLFVLPTGALEKVRVENLDSLATQREPDAVARADGTFDLPPQTPGRYDVVASHPDAMAGRALRVDLTAGDASGVDVELGPAGSVRGQLLDEHGRPVEEEQIYVLYPDGFVVLVDVREEGRFERKQLRVGRCVVRWLSMKDEKAYAAIVGGKDVQAKRAAYDELRQDGGEHAVTDGGVVAVTLTLPRRVRVTGRVLKGGAVDPRVRFAWMRMNGARKWVRIEADENGDYAKDLEAGTYKVWLQRVESEWVQIDVVIPEGAEFRLDLDAP